MRAGRVTGAEHEGQYEGGDGVTHAHGEQGDGDDVSGHEGSTTGNRPSTDAGSSTSTGARTSATTGTGARTPTSTGTTPSTGPRVDISELVRTRTRHPEAIAEAAARRVRRPLLNDAGRLMIVAADHPARGALGVGDRKFAMANRAELLERLCLAVSRPGVDGVLATADILDDLLLLGALDGKVVMGSMNRGGLQGASFELDDRFTGHRAQDIERLRFDAGKLLLRIDYDDPGSLTTLESTARAIDDMAARQLPLFVEPFISRRTDEGKLRNDLSAEAVIKSIAISSGLGGTSAYTWLKLPVTENPDDMAQVMETSTLPAVLLGGEVGDDQDGAYEKWRGALQLPTVRGLVVGRSLLYPPDGDVAAAVDTAVGLL